MENNITVTEASKGRIIMCEGGLYTLRLDNGTVLKCRARGSFRYKNMSPEAGDAAMVRYSVLPDGSVAEYEKDGRMIALDAVIESIEPRKNLLIRPPIANLDYMFVTVASASPEPVITTVDKMVCICEYNKIEPVIVVGKSELSPDIAHYIADIYSGAGYKTFTVSCHRDEGIKQLCDFVKEILSGRVAAFAGASGVGKSTLMNMLFPGLGLETSDISRKIERGRHTTRKVMLFPFYGGYIADTPGFSMLDFEHFDFFGKDDLFGTYREFGRFFGKCRYTKCTHTKEDGCAVLDAVRNGEIAQSRHDSYVELYNILKAKKAWDKGKK